MSDEIKNTENEVPKVDSSIELPDAALEQVAGGAAAPSDITITQPVDQASPKLYEALHNGTHIPKVTIELTRPSGSTPSTN